MRNGDAARHEKNLIPVLLVKAANPVEDQFIRCRGTACRAPTTFTARSKLTGIKFLPETLRAPQSGATPSTFGGGACYAEPERSGGEASQILRRIAPQHDIDIGPSE